MKKIIKEQKLSTITVIVIVLSILNSSITSISIPLLSSLPSHLNDYNHLKEIIIKIILIYGIGVVVNTIYIESRKTMEHMHVGKTIRSLLDKELKCSSKELMTVDSGVIRSYIEDYAMFNTSVMIISLQMLNVVIILGKMLMEMWQKIGIFPPIITICIVMSLSALFKLVFMKFNRVEAHESKAKLTGITQDVLSNVRTLKCLKIDDWAVGKIKNAQIEYQDISFRTGFIRTLLSNFLAHLSVSPILICIWMLRGTGDVELATFVIMTEWCIDQSIGMFLSLTESISERNDIKSKLKILDSEDTRPISRIKQVNLQNVVFGYPENDIIFKTKDIKINFGDRYAITGESGQGKSSLANLLAGMLNPIEGSIPKLPIYYIWQETECLNMSIRENICFDEEISDEHIYELMSSLGLNDWLQSLPDGLDTILGERGTKVSSGQKQRINIVRAIVRMEKCSDEIIILDEPTSNLDGTTEKLVCEMINMFCKQTLIIITHRPEICKICDHHIKVENHIFEEI